jgi:hypothetical protein
MFFFRKPAHKRPARSSVAPRAQLAVEALETRLVPYAITGNAWPSPQLVTISFMPDGTYLADGAQSNLFATMNAKFGSTAAWQNIILKAAQDWAAQTNLNFAVVSDNGTDQGMGNYQQGDPGMGDIRIGGETLGSNYLGEAYMPPPANNFDVAGDVEFNTSKTWNIGSDYDLYTVTVHELGHALGLTHSTVSTADMYGYYSGVKTGLTSDDIAGVRAIYSSGNVRSADAYNAANYSLATAANLGGLLNVNTLAGQATNLNLSTVGQQEYFTVTAPLLTTSHFTVNVQSSGLSLLAPTLTVYNANQVQVGYVSGGMQYGTTLSLTFNNVTAGQKFYIKVTGADSSSFSTGSYVLSMNFGSGAMPTVQLPNTQLLNGANLNCGGGVAMQLPDAMEIAPGYVPQFGSNQLWHGGPMGPGDWHYLYQFLTGTGQFGSWVGGSTTSGFSTWTICGVAGPNLAATAVQTQGTAQQACDQYFADPNWMNTFLMNSGLTW